MYTYYVQFEDYKYNLYFIIIVFNKVLYCARQ